MQNASAADDDDAEYEADGENDECNENATIMAIPRTTRARIIRLLGLIIVPTKIGYIRRPAGTRLPDGDERVSIDLSGDRLSSVPHGRQEQ